MNASMMLLSLSRHDLMSLNGKSWNFSLKSKIKKFLFDHKKKLEIKNEREEAGNEKWDAASSPQHNVVIRRWT